MSKPKVLVIVGPTASGKTSLSIALAQRFHGEIVSADSRQVYRGLNLGTGKVTEIEMQGVPHHLLDVADPKDTYTAHDYIRDSRKVIDEIASRTHLPIIVGGTFFYIDALLGKFVLPETPPNPELRKKLEELDTNTLYAHLKAKDPAYADIVDRDNPRRLIRALEIIEALGHMPTFVSEPLYNSLTLGVHIEKEELYTNIKKRLIDRIEAGMIDEVKQLHDHGLSYERMEDLGIEYRYIARHLKGELPYCEMITEIETKSRQYAKCQMTWLKRDTSIVWVNKNDTKYIEQKVASFLK
jgi:tRNA dimethylallyltransferase